MGQGVEVSWGRGGEGGSVGMRRGEREGQWEWKQQKPSTVVALLQSSFSERVTKPGL